MNKYKLSILIVISVIFLLSSVVLGLDSDNVDLEVTLDTWAGLEIIENELFEDVLEGKEGLYISDGHNVKGEAQELWGLGDGDIINHGNVHGILFDIASNEDVNVKVETKFGDDWLDSPSAFLVFEHWSPYVHLGTLNNNHPNGSKEELIEFSHISGGPRQYKIGGAVYIEDYTDDSPGEYSTSITITVEKL